MKNMHYRFFVFFLPILLIVGCGNKDGGTSEGAKRTQATPFTLKGLDNREYSLESVRGKVVLLDFWATWCPPCKKEIPELISIYNKYKGKDFMLFGIGLDKPSALKSFSEKYRIPYPVLIGTKEIGSAYGIRYIPTLYLIDKSGRIANRFQGYREGLTSKIEEEIDKLLEE